MTYGRVHTYTHMRIGKDKGETQRATETGAARRTTRRKREKIGQRERG